MHSEYFAFHDRAHARDQEPRIFRGYLRPAAVCALEQCYSLKHCPPRSREDVLGYFTDRGEAEIICDPAAVRLDGESGGTA